jgi:hypothetical protein
MDHGVDAFECAVQALVVAHIADEVASARRSHRG